MSGVLDWVRSMTGTASPPPAPAIVAPDRSGICIAWILRCEGGFVDNPADPGAATNMGIDTATLAAWRGCPVTADDVRALQQPEAIAIYTAQFWNQMRCAELPAGVDLSVLDAGVMSGPRQGVRFLQAACGVTIDGVVGPKTLAAAKAASAASLIASIANERDQYYEGLARANDNDQEFLRGWENRVQLTDDQSVAMAA